jgi:DNA polymerase-3 subunit delta
MISGDEPLLTQEAADSVRRIAREAGHEEREVFTADRSFDWLAFGASLNSPSLFATRRLVELRVPSGKPGKQGGQVLADYVVRPDPDVVLLILLPRLDQQSLKTAWARKVDGAGLVCRVWPPTRRELPDWVSARMRAAGMNPDREAAAMIAERCEGNLLAAHQEIEKLGLLSGGGRVDADTVAAAVSDSSRFDVFQLADAVILGDLPRAIRILRGLRGEGLEPPVILWAIAREVRTIARAQSLVGQGRAVGDAMASLKVWKSRRPVIQSAMRRMSRRRAHELLRQAARADRVIKGAVKGDAWTEITGLVMAAAGPAVERAA